MVEKEAIWWMGAISKRMRRGNHNEELQSKFERLGIFFRLEAIRWARKARPSSPGPTLHVCEISVARYLELMSNQDQEPTSATWIFCCCYNIC